MPEPTTTLVKAKSRGADSFLLGPTDSADSHFAITPSDTVQQPFFSRGVYVGVGGDIVVEMKDPANPGDYVALPYKNAQSGSILQISPRRIKFTGTSATNLIGLL